ncbi:unnamed protein product [Camellia sinensis]
MVALVVGLLYIRLSFTTLKRCTRKLLQWKPALSKEADAYGWTLLHYAARFGHVLRAKDLLNADKSVAYITDKDDKNTAIHLAASQGHVCVIEELIAHCMDCWEMVDGRGQNILHIAVKNQKKRAIQFILQKFPLSSLINQKDVDRNTPLHLLAASDCYKAGLVRHPKADMMAFNNASLTPLDVVCSKSIEPWISEDQQTPHFIVAALIATVTFAAGFTVLGGYDARQGFDYGTAILARKATFKAFVKNGFYGHDIFNHCHHYASAYCLIFIAMGAMVLAFITGMH